MFKYDPALNINKAEIKKKKNYTYFLYQGEFYEQINGVVMGSPLVLYLLVINLFLGYYKTLELNIALLWWVVVA